MYSINCSYGHLLYWENIEQCVKDKDHIAGLIICLTAIPIWSAAHISQYAILRSRAKSASSPRILSYIFTHWLADCIGVVSAFLAQQWLSQIIFGLCVLLVHTLCCLHYLIAPLQTQTNIVSIDKKLTVKKRGKMKNCPHMLSLLFLPAVIVVLCGKDFLSSGLYVRSLYHSQDTYPDYHIPHIVGYTFGSLAGALHISTTLIDMLDAYITVESSLHLIFAYVLRITGESAYVTGVFIQNTTLYSHIHSLPWTIPRLIAAGLNIGILIQRCIQRKKGKRRKLSREDTECLLSSESDVEFHTDDSEEEVIWMPLKSVQSAIPTHPVCISRVQILSEADVPPEVMSPVENEAEYSNVSDDENTEKETTFIDDQDSHVD